MITVKIFVFNPFQENTYVLYDQSGECIVVDAGNSTQEENKQLISFLEEESLKPVQLINTHGHIDHIFGNTWFYKEYGMKTKVHRSDEPIIRGAKEHGYLFGINMDTPPPVGKYLEDDELISFGQSSLKSIHIPGHSPGSLVFYSKEDAFVIVGDVLFQGGIGRTDLPGGDYTTLINGILNKLFTLDDEVVVYPGHGPDTTIGKERKFNPFFN
jgi:glyoxylase-like metal-dependent hydrolase (beta-lactamase superfamily II)